MKVTFVDLPESLRQPLDELAPLLSFALSDSGIPVTVRRNEVGPRIIVDGDSITIEYHKLPEFCRMLTVLPSRIGVDGVYEEHPAFEDLCLMSDCSRNAVYNLDSAKRMIRYLALMGYTSFMLYTEDTYEIPEYPMFGYMRGRFTQQELRAIDNYAAAFGIEVIPCIQVLGHLEHMLKWSAFKSVRDEKHTLLVGEEKTYELIDAMLRACRACFRTDRIHIGMDEVHQLGLGNYLDRNGYRPRSDIFLEHLGRVVEMCTQHGYAPMIWSDMFFRDAFHVDYYVSEGEIPPEVIAKVPREVSLVYWDYNQSKEETVRHMIHCHKQFGNPVVLAGGAWKWLSMTPRNYFSLDINDLFLRLAREEQIPMVIATTWGDDGSEASLFSVMPTLQQYAEYCYARGEDRAWVAARFEQTYHMAFDDFLLIDSPNLTSVTSPKWSVAIGPKQFLYNDPLIGLADVHIKDCFAQEYADKADALARVPQNQFSYLINTAEALCRLLALKTTLSIDIRRAYTDGDRDALAALADERIPAVIEALDRYHDAARDEWYRDNKMFGFEVVELRLGGIRQRLYTAQYTLHQYLDGKISRIESLDQPLQMTPNTDWLTFPKMYSACMVP